MSMSILTSLFIVLILLMILKVVKPDVSISSVNGYMMQGMQNVDVLKVRNVNITNPASW